MKTHTVDEALEFVRTSGTMGASEVWERAEVLADEVDRLRLEIARVTGERKAAAALLQQVTQHEDGDHDPACGECFRCLQGEPLRCELLCQV